MSNVIPPLLSDSPPPIVIPDNEEDEFGDFNSAIDVSFTYENLSLPSTPQHEPLRDVSKIENFDINSNTSIKNVEYRNHVNDLFSMHIAKDFQDKRKTCDISMGLSEADVNLEKDHNGEIINHVNNCKNNAISQNDICNEQHLAEINDCVMQNRSVPIDTSLHNLQCLNKVHDDIVPDGSSETENVNYANGWVNVPCSNRLSLDDIKNNHEEEKCGTFNAYNIINKDDMAKAPLDLNIVPIETDTETRIHKEETLEGAIEESYLNEAPPDLHIIDDSKVQVEDFRYYDVYDEHNLEHHDQDMFDDNTHTEIKAICQSTEICVNNVIKNTEKIDNAILEIQNHSQDVSEINTANVKDEADIELEYLETSLQDLSTGIGDYEIPIVSKEYSANGPSQIFNENITGDKDKNGVEDEQRNINCLENNKLDVGEYFKKDFTESNNTGIEDDNFSKFTDPGSTKDKVHQDPPAENIFFSDEVDGFCDFGKFEDGKNHMQVSVIENSNVNLHVAHEPACSSKDCVSFANFDDITSGTSYTEPTMSGLQGVNSSDQVSSIPNLSDEDEFGDFGDYTHSSSNNELPLATVQTAVHSTSTINKDELLENIDKILLEMYPSCESNYDNFVLVDISETDLVFKNIKDVTETNALTYQWSNSVSQDHLLKALNIDTRNILYGPGWNPMMPKFAANLGVTPLQPVKSSDIIASQSGTTNSVELNSSSSTQVDIPNAQFDWNGSGLINPLDCHAKDNSQKSNISEPDINLDQLDKNRDTLTPVLRARFHSDNESVKSLQLTTDITQDLEETSKPEQTVNTFEEDFDEFTSYQSHQPTDYSQLSNVTLPLRETHISNENGSERLQMESCEHKKKNDSDNEFTDFRFNLPNLSNLQKAPDNSKTVTDRFTVFGTNTLLQPVLEPLKPMPVDKKEKEQTQINWPNPGISDEDILNIELTYCRNQPLVLKEPGVDVGMTTMKLPNISENSKNNIHNHRPIIPSPSSSFNSISQETTNCPATNAISIVGDSNRKFNSKHKTPDKQSRSTELYAPSNNSINLPQTSNTVGKCGDDDDWSDFICNPQPMKTKKTFQSSGKQQVPELRLSVPHLNQLQQPKKPIPVITPQGLIQTRIPTNINNISNISVQQPSFSIPNQTSNAFQPAIISHQYQNHMNGSMFNKTNINGLYNGPIAQQVAYNQIPPSSNVNRTNNISSDDDDWTDFISGPPVQSNKRPTNSQSVNILRTNITGNSSVAMPNIIANPAHSNYNLYVNKNNFGAQPSSVRKSNVNLGGPLTISSISALPDLEFIAPKTRTFPKK